MIKKLIEIRKEDIEKNGMLGAATTVVSSAASTMLPVGMFPDKGESVIDEDDIKAAALTKSGTVEAMLQPCLLLNGHLWTPDGEKVVTEFSGIEESFVMVLTDDNARFDLINNILAQMLHGDHISLVMMMISSLRDQRMESGHVSALHQRIIDHNAEEGRFMEESNGVDVRASAPSADSLNRLHKFLEEE